VAVLPPKRGPKEDPVAANLIASLVHPERKVSIWTVQFSPDGKRLFTAGYPSGIVQIWDVAARKELRRIDSPAGYRGSAAYALLTPDWKTLYVPVEKRTVKLIERGGKRLHRVDYSGEVRVWDVVTGKEKAPLRPAEGTAPSNAWLAPGGRRLVCVERPGYDTSDPRTKDVTVVWDLAAGKKWKLCDGYAYPSFAPDGKTAVVSEEDHAAKTSSVRVLDLTSGKELAKQRCPEKGRSFSVGAVAPDGSVVAVSLGGKKAAPVEVWFLDAKSLAERGKLVGKGDPERYGWGSGRFTPDGKCYVLLDGVGNALVWDVAGQKLERTVPLGGGRAAWQLAVSPEGRTLAVGWAPKAEADLEDVREPDPLDLPQPRVSLVDLTGQSPPRVLIAPHGYTGGLAFAPDGKTLAFGGAGAVHLFDLTR
jgi:WD40 repeat protein